MSRPRLHPDRIAQRPTRRARPALLAALTLGAALTGCARNEPPADLLLPINPLCTTCNDFIRCDADAPPGAPAGVDFALLHLQPKGFLAQMATVFDYLLQAFREREEDRRPLVVYTARDPQPASGAEAVTDLVRHRISVPGGWIDQASGAWHGADDALRGQCRLLPIAEGRALVARLRAAAPSPAAEGTPP